MTVKKPNWKLSTLDNVQLVVHRASILEMVSIREFAADNGYVVVDARTREIDRFFMLLATLLFVTDGSWLLLVLALWNGWDWARSYPRQEGPL